MFTDGNLDAQRYKSLFEIRSFNFICKILNLHEYSQSNYYLLNYRAKEF